jgi:mono/diheme cytochrome c family protein
MQISKLLIAFLIGGIWAATQQYEPTYKTKPSPSTPKEQLFCAVVDSPSSLSEDAQMGKKLFQSNCASCHNKNMKDNMTGPALAGVEERWSKYPKEDLYNYIRESQKMINSGHPQALIVWEDWKPNVMSNFPNLSDEDIEAILSYIKEDVSKR